METATTVPQWGKRRQGKEDNNGGREGKAMRMVMTTREVCGEIACVGGVFGLSDMMLC